MQVVDYHSVEPCSLLYDSTEITGRERGRIIRKFALRFSSSPPSSLRQ